MAIENRGLVEGNTNKMIVGNYIKETDFQSVKDWVQNERIHYLWCAGRFEYPLEIGDFHNVLEIYQKEYGDETCFVTDDDGKSIGFFVVNKNNQDNCAFLKFIVLNKLDKA